VLVVVVTTAAAARPGATDALESLLATITQAELRDAVAYLASDELGGREMGSDGFLAAARYAAAQFRKDGLGPAGDTASGIRTYEHKVPFVSYDVAPSSVLFIRSAGTELRTTHGEKMIVFRTATADPDLFVNERPVFLGYGIDDPEAGWSDYRDVDVRGRVVVVAVGAPSRNGAPVLRPDMDAYYRDFNRSGNARFVWAAAHGAAAIIFVPDAAMASRWDRLVTGLSRRQFTLAAAGVRSAGSPACLFLHPDVWSDVLKRAAGSWPDWTAGYVPGELPDTRLSARIDTLRLREADCRNVVAMLPGTDQVLRDEFVVVHAHLDHLGPDAEGRVRNGADDNAAGAAALIETAEALAAHPLRRSVVFALFTGEEEGQLGSEWFLRHAPMPPDRIVLSVTADMIGRTSTGRPDVHYVVAGGTGAEHGLAAARRAGPVAGARVDDSLNARDPDGHLYRSDAGPFLARGITSLLITRGFFPPVYHSVDDDAQTLDWPKVERGARLLAAAVVEYDRSAGGDRRVGEGPR
jgi:hypothetical protein